MSAAYRDGLDTARSRRLGLVQHLCWVERRWMRWGSPPGMSYPYPAGGNEGEWTPAPEIIEVLSRFADEVEQSRAVTL